MVTSNLIRSTVTPSTQDGSRRCGLFIRAALTLTVLLSAGSLGAQTIAVKSNILCDLSATLNAGVEYRFAPKWTADLGGSLNAWTFKNNKKWKNWILQPEARYWLCDAWAGHFLAVHAQGGQFNIGGIDSSLKILGTDFSVLKDRRYQGWLAGLGVGYGYAWILSEHWNLEAEAGLGWTRCWYDTFRCAGCGKKVATDNIHDWFGPTKLAVSIVYLF